MKTLKEEKEPSRQEIWKMFDQISQTYDLVNRIMTGGCDSYWRKKMGKFLPQKEAISLLDCATGTGDHIFSLLSHYDKIESIVGIDLSKEMLAIAKKKAERFLNKVDIRLQEANLLDLPFPSNRFDCVTIAFGIRNVTDVELALKEMLRVLKPQGRLLILEGSIPRSAWMKPFFFFYLRYVLPLIGTLLSEHRQAYRYLNQTIETFPYGGAFCALLGQVGFSAAQEHPLMGGIVTIYTADKLRF